MNAPESLSVGLILFEGVTQLDFTGPYEVFSRMPGTKVHLVAESTAPLRTEWGLMFTPETTFGSAPPLDVICVPGGWGVNAQLGNAALRNFLRERAPSARYVTSVCTGALLLGAAGLLDGYRATTHWMSVGFLERFGAIHVDERVVIDRNRITGGGVRRSRRSSWTQCRLRSTAVSRAQRSLQVSLETLFPSDIQSCSEGKEPAGRATIGRSGDAVGRPLSVRKL